MLSEAKHLFLPAVYISGAVAEQHELFVPPAPARRRRACPSGRRVSPAMSRYV